jgi:flavin-dependent dehydrogenase
MRVAVVGAGIAGLLTSYHLVRGRLAPEVHLYEARSSVGRLHCAGLVSLPTASRLPKSSEVTLDLYRAIEIYVPELRLRLRLSSERPSFLRLDRLKLEELLAEELARRGVRLLLGSPVRGVSRGDGRLLLHVGRGTEPYDFVVVATGYSPRFTGSLGLTSSLQTLPGVQLEVEVGGGRWLEEGTAYAVISNYLGRGFAWVVPGSYGRVLLGCATHPRGPPALNCLRTLLRVIERKSTSVRVLSKPYGGVVLRGYPGKVVASSVAGVGDSVAMVKSLSGGGLYAISVASKLVADYVNGDVKALEALEVLKWELALQYRLTKYVYRLVRLLEVTGLRGRSVDVWLRYLDYDHHLKLLVQLLGNARSYLALVRGRVELELKYSTGDLRWCSR